MFLPSFTKSPVTAVRVEGLHFELFCGLCGLVGVFFPRLHQFLMEIPMRNRSQCGAGRRPCPAIRQRCRSSLPAAGAPRSPAGRPPPRGQARAGWEGGGGGCSAHPVPPRAATATCWGHRATDGPVPRWPPVPPGAGRCGGCRGWGQPSTSMRVLTTSITAPRMAPVFFPFPCSSSFLNHPTSGT